MRAGLFIRRSAVALLLLCLAVVPAFAQEDSDGDQSTDPSSDQPVVVDQSDAPTETPTVDVGAVVAEWGPAPTDDQLNKAVATRWFNNQNQKRARYGVPTANRDPYLDWEAENLLRDYLGQPRADLPSGLSKPAAATGSQTDSAIQNESQFWTVSDAAWQAYLVRTRRSRRLIGKPTTQASSGSQKTTTLNSTN